MLVAGGPSLDAAQLETLRRAREAGRCRVLCVNNAGLAAPWADLLYACDFAWWQAHAAPFDGFPSWHGFAGLLVTQDARARALDARIRRVPLEPELAGLSVDPLRIRSGGNGGFQALNIALLLGAARILLVGYDLKAGRNGEAHWHGRHGPGLNNPTEAGNLRHWRLNFAAAVPDLARAGVAVLNCTPGSALTCFPAGDLENALWSVSPRRTSG